MSRGSVVSSAPAVRSAVDPAALDYGEDGLLPVVVQDVVSGAVLMVAYADREAVDATLATGFAHFHSRSRDALWKKGETSGNVLRVRSVAADCDSDALLYRADPTGPTCHRGTRSCFEEPGEGVSGARLELGWLWEVLQERRRTAPEGSYTARLLAAGVDRVARKVGEEATETVIAALRAAPTGARPPEAGEDAGGEGDELAAEAADLLYHLLVLLLAAGSEPGAVAAELRRRHAAPRRPAPAKPEDPPAAGGRR